MTAPDLRAVFEKARLGDACASEALMALLRPRLLALVRRRLGDDLGAYLDPEDILQETSLRTLRGLSGVHWQGDDALARWVESIARNVILEAARRLRRQPECLLADVQDSSPSAGRRQRQGERFDRLAAALKKLDPEHRRVLILARIEGIPIAEIARRTQKTSNAVSKLILRALRRLRQEFGDTESFSLPDRALPPPTGTARQES